LIRKKINIPSDIGLLCETLILTPFALIAFYYLSVNNLNIFSFDKPLLSFYLFWAGLMTLVPLYLYIRGFEIVGIGTASMIFFLTPTSQFLMGHYIYNEPLDINKLIAFIFIWISVIIYLNEIRKE
jgi:chloramphenicol-sensitive protein RarD